MSSVDLERGRSARRHKVFHPGETIVAGQRGRAHLLDISETGALIHAPTAPERGVGIVVDLGSRQRTARVVWRDGKRFGVLFAVPLTLGELAELIETRERQVKAAAGRLHLRYGAAARNPMPMPPAR